MTTAPDHNPKRARPRARASRWASAALAVGLLAVRAAAGDPPRPYQPGLAADRSLRLSDRIPAGDSGLRLAARLDDRLDDRIYDRVEDSAPSDRAPTADRRAGAPVRRLATGTTGIPYRVDPREADDGALGTSWELPPEVPDPRDFDRVQTFDELANPHYEIREEIWNTPEDFITPEGYAQEDGLAYVPFWARNAIRIGRAQLFPFVSVQGIWHSNISGGSREESAFEVAASSGVLAEYLLRGGRTKIKAGMRGTYHLYEDVLTDGWTFVGGVGFEHRLSAPLTVDAGIEAERSVAPLERNTSGAGFDTRLEAWTGYANVRLDAVPSRDFRLEVGGRYSETEDLDLSAGDHDDLMLYARAGFAVMRHESFGYVEYRYETREAHDPSPDLTSAHEVRVGVNGIVPHARVRRLVGNVWAGYRWESYEAGSAVGGGVGEDGDAETWVAGAELTYRPSPYTSGYLSYEHTNAFSVLANFNTTDTLTLAVTQNLSNRVVARGAASWTLIEPDGRGSENWLGLGAGVRWAITDSLDLTADYEYDHRFAGAGFAEADSHRISVGMTLQLR